MARRPRPWFRASTACWMVTLNGRQHKLSEGFENRALAERRFHELMLVQAQHPGHPDATVAAICDAYLVWCEEHRSSETYRQHFFYLQKFAEGCGLIRVADLKPYDVNTFLQSKKSWNSTTRFNLVRIAKRALNWGMKEGLLDRNPLQHLERPRPRRRERGLSEQEYRALYRGAAIPLKTIIFALWHTGARPGELRRLRWSEVQASRLVIKDHKTVGNTDRPRVIPLSSRMQKLLAALRRQATEEFVFVNCRGKPWTTNALRLQFQRLRKKLGLADDVTAYLFRHGFATRALKNGVPAATVAAMLGHTSTEMVMSVYGHLVDEEEHLLEAVERANRRAG